MSENGHSPPRAPSDGAPPPPQPQPQRQRRKKCILYSVLAAFIVVLASVAIVLAVVFTRHHPPPVPFFRMGAATIQDIHPTPPPHAAVNATVQVTILVENGKSRKVVSFNNMMVYAEFSGQRITLDAPLKPVDPQQIDGNVVSASLNGLDIPLSDAVQYELWGEMKTGMIQLTIVAYGYTRDGAGSGTAEVRRFEIKCTGLVGLRPAYSGLMKDPPPCTSDL